MMHQLAVFCNNSTPSAHPYKHTYIHTCMRFHYRFDVLGGALLHPFPDPPTFLTPFFCLLATSAPSRAMLFIPLTPLTDTHRSPFAQEGDRACMNWYEYTHTSYYTVNYFKTAFPFWGHITIQISSKFSPKRDCAGSKRHDIILSSLAISSTMSSSTGDHSK